MQKRVIFNIIAIIFMGLVIICEANEFVFGIPQVQTEVVVDGQLQEREWFFSAQLPALHKVDNWAENDSGIKLRMQYDAENVYLAFEITRPQGFEAPQIVPEDETLNFTEDSIRLILENKNGVKQELLGNAASQLKKTDGSQTDIQYQTRITSAGWQGEVQIPYNLELEGELWFNFINEQETPIALYSALAFMETDKENLWKLVPRGNNPVLAFFPEKTEQTDRSALWYKLINNQDTTSGYTANFKVASQEETLSEELTATWQLIAEEEAFFQEEQILKYSCQENKFVVSAEKGRYIVSYKFLDPNEQIIAQGLLFFKNQFPISFSITPYFLTRNIIEIKSDLKETPPVNSVLEMTAYEAGFPDRVIAKKQVHVNERLSWVEELSTANCKENTAYHLHFKLTDGNALLAEETVVFNRPANPVWYQNIFGRKEFIPKPFTPLVYEQGRVDVWGRTISLGDNLLPSQIISQQQELLSSPVELVLEIDGVPVTFKKSSKEVIEQTKEGVTLRYKLDSTKFALRVSLRAEFDGYLWYNLEIDPKGPVTINKAILKIPLFSKQATLFNVYGHGPGTIPPTTRMSASEFTKAGATTDYMELPFYPFIWFGNEERGIQFFTESDQHWKVASNKAYLLKKEGLDADFSVQLVNQNKQIASPVSYGFGLMASPVKPLGQRERFWCGTSLVWGGYGDNPSHFKSEESLAEFEERVVGPWLAEPEKSWDLTATLYRDYNVKLGNISSWNPLFGAPYTEDELFNEKLTLMIEETKKAVPEMKITAYTGWGINKGFSFWDSFGMEMTRRPWEASGWNTMLHCPNSSFTDFFAYGVDYMWRYYGLDGAYLDSTGNVPMCNRTGHGCGYVDEDGVLHGTYPIRATRELFKRIYKITHCGADGDEIIYLHTNGMLLPIISFADLLYMAEPGVIIWDKLKDIDLAEYRAQFINEPFGPPIKICWHTFSPHLKLAPNHMQGFALVHGQTIGMEPKALLNYSSGYQQPGYGEDKYPLRHIFSLFDDFIGGDEVDFYPYWQNEQYLAVQNEEVLGSFYLNSKGEALLVFCNLSEQSQHVIAKFDKPSGQIVEITDPFLNTKLSTHEGWIALDLLPQGYRLLWVK